MSNSISSNAPPQPQLVTAITSNHDDIKLSSSKRTLSLKPINGNTTSLSVPSNFQSNLKAKMITGNIPNNNYFKFNESSSIDKLHLQLKHPIITDLSKTGTSFNLDHSHQISNNEQGQKLREQIELALTKKETAQLHSDYVLKNASEHKAKVYFNPCKRIESGDIEKQAKLETKRTLQDQAYDDVQSIKKQLRVPDLNLKEKDKLEINLNSALSIKETLKYTNEEKQFLKEFANKQTAQKEYSYVHSVKSGELFNDPHHNTRKNEQRISDDLIKGKLSDQAWYTGTVNPLISQNNSQDIRSISINGHGNPGDNKLEQGRNGERVSYQEVADRLIESGLSKDFSGDIKLYNCHSSESGNEIFAFADLFTMYMWEKGYTECKIHGYEGSLDSFPKPDESDKNQTEQHNTQYHKYSRNTGIPGKNGAKDPRASDMRSEITPEWLGAKYANKINLTLSNTLSELQNSSKSHNGWKSSELKDFEEKLNAYMTSSDNTQNTLQNMGSQKEFDSLKTSFEKLKNNKTVIHGFTSLFNSNSKSEYENRISKNTRDELSKIFPQSELVDTNILKVPVSAYLSKSESYKDLSSIIGNENTNKIANRIAQQYGINSIFDLTNNNLLGLEEALKKETKNLNKASNSIERLFNKNLDRSIYSSKLDLSSYSKENDKSNFDFAASWILKASSSKGNERNNFIQLLKQYSEGDQDLTNIDVLNDLHLKLVPDLTEDYRGPSLQGGNLPSSVGGMTLLESHLNKLKSNDTKDSELGKLLLAGVIGYHGFTDGNGRMARTLYAICELRQGKFEALTPKSEELLHGLNHSYQELQTLDNLETEIHKDLNQRQEQVNRVTGGQNQFNVNLEEKRDVLTNPNLTNYFDNEEDMIEYMTRG